MAASPQSKPRSSTRTTTGDACAEGSPGRSADAAAPGVASTAATSAAAPRVRSRPFMTATVSRPGYPPVTRGYVGVTAQADPVPLAPACEPTSGRPSPMGMDFGILGPLEVRDGDRSVPLAGRQRSILALLLIRRDEAVSYERLIEELWSDPPPRTAAKSVQVPRIGAAPGLRRRRRGPAGAADMRSSLSRGRSTWTGSSACTRRRPR